MGLEVEAVGEESLQHVFFFEFCLIVGKPGELLVDGVIAFCVDVIEAGVDPVRAVGDFEGRESIGKLNQHLHGVSFGLELAAMERADESDGPRGIVAGRLDFADGGDVEGERRRVGDGIHRGRLAEGSGRHGNCSGGGQALRRKRDHGERECGDRGENRAAEMRAWSMHGRHMRIVR